MRRLITYAYILLAILSFVFVTIDYTSINKHKNPNIQNSESSNTHSTYTVKEYNNRIAVFSNGSTEPDYVLDSPYVHDLPEYDQNLLANGISAKSEAEVRIILEDYDN